MQVTGMEKILKKILSKTNASINILNFSILNEVNDLFSKQISIFLKKGP
jgi:hypothetical protein